MKWHCWLEIIGDACIIAFGILSFMLFMGIVTRGYVHMVEHYAWILYPELILAGIVLLIGTERLIDDAWNIKK